MKQNQLNLNNIIWIIFIEENNEEKALWKISLFHIVYCLICNSVELGNPQSTIHDPRSTIHILYSVCLGTLNIFVLFRSQGPYHLYSGFTVTNLITFFNTFFAFFLLIKKKFRWLLYVVSIMGDENKLLSF